MNDDGFGRGMVSGLILATVVATVMVLLSDVKRNRVLVERLPQQINILKKALSEPQRQRWRHCENTSPCTTVEQIDAYYKCHNTYINACMFQPPERE